MHEGERVKNQLYLVTLMIYENTNEGGILGQKLGYNSCPYLSFFYLDIQRLKIFVSTRSKILKYKTLFFGPKMPCCAYEHECI